MSNIDDKKSYIRYSRDSLIEIAKANQEHFTTQDSWNVFARKNNYPSASTYRDKFGTWGKARQFILGESSLNNTYTKERLKDIALANREYFTSQKNWSRFARNKNLPSASTFCYVFGTWNKAKLEILGVDLRPKEYSREELLKIAKTHIHAFSKKEYWRTYARENELPTPGSFIRVFGSWENVKQAIGLKSGRLRLTDEEMKETALKYKGFFTTMEVWDKFAEKKGFPPSYVYSSRFGGTWNGVKDLFGLEKINSKTVTYTTKELIAIAKRNSEYFTTYNAWSEYTKGDDQLPSPSVYKARFGSWEDARKKIFGIEPKYSKESLTIIAIEHYSEFSKSKEAWEVYAKENGLPWPRTYANYFGSWKLAKMEIEQLVTNNKGEK